MTIGYGDVTPHSKAGKFIGALMVTLGLIVFTVFFSELYDIVQAEKMGADKTLLMRLEELNEVIEADDDGTVSESEYILFNLRKMGKVRRRARTRTRKRTRTPTRTRATTHAPPPHAPSPTHTRPRPRAPDHTTTTTHAPPPPRAATARAAATTARAAPRSPLELPCR